jgi:hypothetical protein
MNDDGRPAKPQLPYDKISSAIGADDAARAELDALNAYLAEAAPDPARIAQHVDALRGVRDAEAHVVIWWDDPVTQGWFKSLGDAGL